MRRFRGNYLLNTDFVLSIWLSGPDGATPGRRHRLSPDPRRQPGHAGGGYRYVDRRAGRRAGAGDARTAPPLALGLHAWPWERLTWHCDTRNLASARVAEKAGLQPGRHPPPESAGYRRPAPRHPHLLHAQIGMAGAVGSVGPSRCTCIVFQLFTTRGAAMRLLRVAAWALLGLLGLGVAMFRAPTPAQADRGLPPLLFNLAQIPHWQPAPAAPLSPASRRSRSGAPPRRWACPTWRWGRRWSVRPYACRWPGPGSPPARPWSSPTTARSH